MSEREGWAEVESLLGTLSDEPSFVEVQRVGRKLLALGAEGVVAPGGKEARIALAGAHTLEPLAFALAVECAREGIAPRIHVDGYNQFAPHMLDPGSELYAFRPELAFLSWDMASLAPTGQDATRLVDEIVEAFTRTTSALLVVHNFAVPDPAPFSTRPRADARERELNDRFERQFAESSQVHVLDFDSLASFHGKSRVTSPKLRALAGVEIGESFTPVVARKYMSYVKALKGLTRKCLVVDLDDTLWGGVVGEEGLDGIALSRNGAGSEYRDLQEAILSLHDRGVILAVNSKNNPDDALRVLRDHPDMLLREEHFTAVRINWQEKAANMREIAEELNIGIDALAFLDTSPVEREWVRRALPEVLVIDLPDDPTLHADVIRQSNDFETLAVTDEDRRRNDLYAAERSRKGLREQSESFESFLRGLEMVLEIGPPARSDIARVGQLTRKTNQFNVTTKRYTDAEIEELAGRADRRIYVLRQSDVFGDAGLVAVAIVHTDDSAWELDTYLMSCRVLGRTVETAFLTEVLADAKRAGASTVRAAFVPTAKNGPAETFFEDAGFETIERGPDGGLRYALDLDEWTAQQPDWFRIERTHVDEVVTVADR